MQLAEDQKFQALSQQLQERYAAAHRMRDRSMQFTIWLSGLAIGLAWLLIGQTTLSAFQRIALTFLIAALWFGAGIFVLGLRKGFQSNRKAMIRSERALALYDRDAYLANDSLLPSAYEHTNGKWNDHFSTLCIWLVVVGALLMALTWTCPEKVMSQKSNKSKMEQITSGGKENGRSK